MVPGTEFIGEVKKSVGLSGCASGEISETMFAFKQHLNLLNGKGISLGASGTVRDGFITPVEVSGLAHSRTMRSSFGARRQARKVGQEEDEEMEDSRPGLVSQEQGNDSALRFSTQLSNVSV